jgi:hypothetical protein
MVTPSWLARRMTTPAEIYHRDADPAADEYGNTVYVDTWVATTTCFMQPVTTAEIQDGRAAVSTYLLTLPAYVDGLIDAFSMFLVDGLAYEVIEPPSSPHSLISAGVHHVEVAVQRSTA